MAMWGYLTLMDRRGSRGTYEHRYEEMGWEDETVLEASENADRLIECESWDRNCDLAYQSDGDIWWLVYCVPWFHGLKYW